jgi:hypothetical protein
MKYESVSKVKYGSNTPSGKNIMLKDTTRKPKTTQYPYYR